MKNTNTKYSKTNLHIFSKIHAFCRENENLSFPLTAEIKSTMIKKCFNDVQLNPEGNPVYLSQRFGDIMKGLGDYFWISEKNNTIHFDTSFMRHENTAHVIQECLSKKENYQTMLSLLERVKSISKIKLFNRYVKILNIDKKSKSEISTFNQNLSILKRQNKIKIINDIVFVQNVTSNFGNFCENKTIIELSENQKPRDIFLKEKNGAYNKAFSLIGLDSNGVGYDIIIRRSSKFVGVSIKSLNTYAHLNSKKDFLNKLDTFSTLSIQDKTCQIFSLAQSPKMISLIGVSHATQKKVYNKNAYTYEKTEYLSIDDFIAYLEEKEKLVEHKKNLHTCMDLTHSDENFIEFQWDENGLILDGKQIIYLDENKSRGFKIHTINLCAIFKEKLTPYPFLKNKVSIDFKTNIEHINKEELKSSSAVKRSKP